MTLIVNYRVLKYGDSLGNELKVFVRPLCAL